eukprot:11471912-Karenia_brevis.AAC.1
MRVVLRGRLPAIRFGITSVPHRRLISRHISNPRARHIFLYCVIVNEDDVDPQHTPGFFFNGRPLRNGPPLRLC